MTVSVSPAAASRALIGLLGHPIALSASPAMHEAAARGLGARAWYQLIEIPGLGAGGLRRVLDSVRLLGFAGINVTFPYKEAVVPLLDDLSPEAAAIGAVNTVVVGRDGRLTGHNTDTTGFRSALRRVIGQLDGTVALVGAGGVGKAAAFALAAEGAPLAIYDTDPSKAQAIAARLGASGFAVPVRLCATVGEALDGAAGLVNGTPVGMLPDTGMPVPDDLLRPDMWVADAVYSPLWTPLLRAAKARRARVMTGRELAIDQAVDAFTLFTRLTPRREDIERAFDRAIEARYAHAAIA